MIKDKYDKKIPFKLYAEKNVVRTIEKEIGRGKKKDINDKRYLIIYIFISIIIKINMIIW